MRYLPAHQYHRMPWRNGGGTTSEIYRNPADGGSFDWRISVADVSLAGPFSQFGGYDRIIVCIDGAGMVLTHGTSEGLTEVVLPPLVVHQFSGDWETSCQLREGPIRDFNLMTRRSECSGTLIVAPISPGNTLTCDFLYLLSGTVTMMDESEGEVTVNRGDSVLQPRAIVEGTGSGLAVTIRRRTA